MKKDRFALIFMIILLCAAGFAAAQGALTAPFRPGGTVEAFFADEKKVSLEACFVEETKYKDMLWGKTRQDFDPSLLYF